jgi:molecular chaperone DnaK
MYAQQGAQGGADPNAGQAGGSSSNNGDNIQDADFEEVK